MTKIICVFASLIIFLSFSTSAEDEGEVSYIPLNPAFVTNYGDIKKIHYLRVEISVRVESLDDIKKVERHIPYLRNNLVMLLSEQTDETVHSLEGREALRLLALEEVNKVLKEEEGGELASDVLFRSFVVQS